MFVFVPFAIVTVLVKKDIVGNHNEEINTTFKEIRIWKKKVFANERYRKYCQGSLCKVISKLL